MSLELSVDGDRAPAILMVLRCDGEHVKTDKSHLSQTGTWYPDMRHAASVLGWKFTAAGEHLGPCCSGKVVAT